MGEDEAPPLMNAPRVQERIMAQAARTSFPHWQNRDGSVDSICTECFRTVATAAAEAELTAAENAHNCQGFNLGEILHGSEFEGRQIRS